MKSLLGVLTVIAVAAVFLLSPAAGGNWPESCGKNKSHNFSWGVKGYYDRLLYVNHTVKPSSFIRKQSFSVLIPPSGTYPRGTITYIQALDQYSDGKGGCVYLEKGGPGYPTVTLHFKSQRNQGVNFIVNVYGH